MSLGKHQKVYALAHNTDRINTDMEFIKQVRRLQPTDSKTQGCMNKFKKYFGCKDTTKTNSTQGFWVNVV